MKTSAFKFMLILIVLFAFIVTPVMAADENPPPTDAPAGMTFATPEMTAFITELATRGAWLGLVILLDLIMGVTLALKFKTFQWQRLADFLSDYGPKVVGWLCLELLNLLPSELKVIIGPSLVGVFGLGAYTIILISGVGSILGNVKALGLLPVSIPGVIPTQKPLNQ